MALLAPLWASDSGSVVPPFTVTFLKCAETELHFKYPNSWHYSVTFYTTHKKRISEVVLERENLAVTYMTVTFEIVLTADSI